MWQVDEKATAMSFPTLPFLSDVSEPDEGKWVQKLHGCSPNLRAFREQYMGKGEWPDILGEGKAGCPQRLV